MIEKRLNYQRAHITVYHQQFIRTDVLTRNCNLKIL